MINYEKLLSKTAVEIKPSGIRKFFDIASEMKDAISLGVGEPDFVTPWNIRESAIFSIEITVFHYTPPVLPCQQQSGGNYFDEFICQKYLQTEVIAV